MTLHLAGIYRREVKASSLRIHENVLDWEHFPALHASNFAACELLGTDARGWRVRFIPQPGDPDAAQTIKLDMALDGLSYKVTTEAGPGTGSEIRVSLTPRSKYHTSVEVQYHIPETDPARLALVGAGFVQIYEKLWDEDEAMMHAREAALAPKPKTAPPARLDLGPESLPLPHIFDWGHKRFRLVRSDGQLIAHAATCPHWLAPLDDTPIEDGCITCPWHGYRFNIHTGQSADGRGLRLPPAPRITTEQGRLIACA
jgi:nitrite reductase/ring-hydroxylating ferredoxin subunit